MGLNSTQYLKKKHITFVVFAVCYDVKIYVILYLQTFFIFNFFFFLFLTFKSPSLASESPEIQHTTLVLSSNPRTNKYATHERKTLEGVKAGQATHAFKVMVGRETKEDP